VNVAQIRQAWAALPARGAGSKEEALVFTETEVMKALHGAMRALYLKSQSEELDSPLVRAIEFTRAEGAKKLKDVRFNAAYALRPDLVDQITQVLPSFGEERSVAACVAEPVQSWGDFERVCARLIETRLLALCAEQSRRASAPELREKKPREKRRKPRDDLVRAPVDDDASPWREMAMPGVGSLHYTEYAKAIGTPLYPHVAANHFQGSFGDYEWPTVAEDPMTLAAHHLVEDLLGAPADDGEALPPLPTVYTPHPEDFRGIELPSDFSLEGLEAYWRAFTRAAKDLKYEAEARDHFSRRENMSWRVWAMQQNLHRAQRKESDGEAALTSSSGERFPSVPFAWPTIADDPATGETHKLVEELLGQDRKTPPPEWDDSDKVLGAISERAKQAGDSVGGGAGLEQYWRAFTNAAKDADAPREDRDNCARRENMSWRVWGMSQLAKRAQESAETKRDVATQTLPGRWIPE